MEQHKAHSARVQRFFHEPLARQHRQLIRYRSIFRVDPIPLQHCTIGFERIERRDTLRYVPVRLIHT